MKSKLITSNNKNTLVAKHPVIVSSQPGMRPRIDKKTQVSKQKATESSQQSLRPKLNTSTDHNTKMSKQEALIPKLITSEGTQLQKLMCSWKGVFEVFAFQMQAAAKYMFWKGNPVHPWTNLVTDIFLL